jgi:hypothetical protein
MEMRNTPIHNIIPTARRISKTTCLHSSPPNLVAKAAAKKNMRSALKATIAEKTVQISTKTPTRQLMFCSESISKHKSGKEIMFRNGHKELNQLPPSNFRKLLPKIIPSVST